MLSALLPRLPELLPLLAMVKMILMMMMALNRIMMRDLRAKGGNGPAGTERKNAIAGNGSNRN
jgi:hypothetical protein